MSGENSFGHSTTLQITKPKSCTAHPARKLVTNHNILHCDGYPAVTKYAVMSETAEKVRHGRAMMSVSCTVPWRTAWIGKLLALGLDEFILEGSMKLCMLNESHQDPKLVIWPLWTMQFCV